MQNYVQPGNRVSTYNSSSRDDHCGNRRHCERAHPHSCRQHSAAVLRRMRDRRGFHPAGELRRLLDRWRDPLLGCNNGWLTSTSGNPLAGSAVGAKLNGSVIQNVKLIDHDEPTGDVLTVPQTAITALAAQTQDALTVTAMTGVANTAPAAETNLDTLTDSTGGTPATTIAALQAGGTGAAAGAWDTANHRDAFIAAVANNFSSLTAELALRKRSIPCSSTMRRASPSS